MRPILSVSVFVLLVGLAGCAAPQGKYDWGNYPNALLAMEQDSTKAPDYEMALQTLVAGDPQRVAPGIYAEYGYVLQTKGDLAGAQKYYGMEKARWPESAVLMDKMIAAIAASKPAA